MSPTNFPRRTLRRLVLAGGAVAGGTLLAAGLGRAADDGGALEFLRWEAARVAATPPAIRHDQGRQPAGFAVVAPAGRGFGTVAPPTRFAALRPGPEERRDAAPEPPRTVCVRTCDGYAFPLGRLARSADVAAHQAGCAAACPGAATALYTLPTGSDDPARATSLTGQPYARLATAGLFRRGVVPGCACRGPSVPQTPIVRDPTLQTGDVVAERLGARAVVADAEGRRGLVEFRRPGALPPAVRREIDRLTDTTRREVAEAVFRRDLGRRHAALAAGRAEAPRIRLAAAGGFAVLGAPAGFSAVRVVVPSPYVVR